MVNLETGIYRITPIKNKFTAWIAWYSKLGCNSLGICDKHGWMTQYSIYFNNKELNPIGNTTRYSTKELALENATSYILKIDKKQNILLYIKDYPVYDNSGGVSLKIEKIN